MSIFSTLQELALFQLYDEFTPQSTAQYIAGLALCIIGVAIIAYRPDGASKTDSGVEKDALMQAGLLKEFNDSGGEQDADESESEGLRVPKVGITRR
jgi:hypothetical protein